VPVGPHLWGITLDESSGTLYLTHTGTGDIVALNEKTYGVKVIPVGSIPCAVAVNPVTHMIYAVNYGDETISAVDAVQGKVIATLKLGKHPQGVAVDSVHNLIYVVNVHSDSVTVIDGSRNAVIGTYDAGSNPYALAVDPDGGHVFAANFGESSITAIDISHIADRK
jgi:YVTN family beta-propeller protein